jgi:hypothetical protein
MGLHVVRACRSSELPDETNSDNKLLIHKPIWAYGIQLWGTASSCNIEILERFQSKALRMITDAPWYVPNTVVRKFAVLFLWGALSDERKCLQFAV